LQWNNIAPVRRYELDGTFVDDFTSVGVNQAIGLDWDTAGDLYVSSYNGAFVQRFDTNGDNLGFFVTTDLAGPTNIWFDDAGDLLVSDFDGGNVRRFDSGGNYREDFILGILMAEGVDFYPNGDILIGSGGTEEVRRYDSNGQFLEATVERGAGGLLKPNAVVLREQFADFVINAGLNDAWFNASTPGQGFFVTVFPDSGQVFLAWFTYDTERPDESVTAILGEPGHRWLTAFGPYEGDTATWISN
jgi:sugar lactone lactonase YvrE